MTYIDYNGIHYSICSSTTVGVLTRRRERFHIQDTSRNINFIHTERIVPTAETKQESIGDHVTGRGVATPTAGTGSAEKARSMPVVPAREGDSVVATTTASAAASEVTVRESEVSVPVRVTYVHSTVKCSHNYFTRPVYNYYRSANGCVLKRLFSVCTCWVHH